MRYVTWEVEKGHIVETICLSSARTDAKMFGRAIRFLRFALTLLMDCDLGSKIGCLMDGDSGHRVPQKGNTKRKNLLANITNFKIPSYREIDLQGTMKKVR